MEIKKVVELRNTEKVDSALVEKTRRTLKSVWDDGGGLGFIEQLLKKVCNPDKYSLLPLAKEKAQALGLVDASGNIPRDITNIILSAFQPKNLAVSGLGYLEFGEIYAPVNPIAPTRKNQMSPHYLAVPNSNPNLPTLKIN